MLVHRPRSYTNITTALVQRLAFAGFAMCYAMLCYAMLCYAMLCYTMLCYAMLCYILWYGMIWYGMVWYGMVWYAMLCYAMLCYAMLCYAMLSLLNNNSYGNNMQLIFLHLKTDVYILFLACLTTFNLIDLFFQTIALFSNLL